MQSGRLERRARENVPLMLPAEPGWEKELNPIQLEKSPIKFMAVLRAELGEREYRHRFFNKQSYRLSLFYELNFECSNA